MVEFGHLPPIEKSLGKKKGQARHLENEIYKARQPPAGGLDTPVGIQKLGCHSDFVRMFIQKSNQTLKALGLKPNIRIGNENKIRLGCLYALIVGGRPAKILTILYHRRRLVPFLDFFYGRIRGIVVNKDCLVPNSRKFFKTLQKCGQGVGRIEGDANNRDCRVIHCGDTL